MELQTIVLTQKNYYSQPHLNFMGIHIPINDVIDAEVEEFNKNTK